MVNRKTIVAIGKEHKKYNFMITMNGEQKECETLPEALEYISNNWKEKENPNIAGTFHCMIKLFSDKNVITERGFVIGCSEESVKDANKLNF